MIYFDMDGVLCDFDGEVTRITGQPWDSRHQNKSTDEKWANISVSPTFFLDLKWIKGADRLLKYAMQLDDVGICSAMSQHMPQSKEHKLLWLLRETPLIPKRNIHIVDHRKHKSIFANANVLIDDSEENINVWDACGGYGILFRNPKQAAYELYHYFQSQVPHLLNSFI